MFVRVRMIPVIGIVICPILSVSSKTISICNKANSAFHPYVVDKSSTNLLGWGEGGAVTAVGWQITLCDPIGKWRPIVLR